MMDEPKLVVIVKIEIYENGWVRWVHQPGEDSLPEPVRYPWQCLAQLAQAQKTVRERSVPWSNGGVLG